MLGLGCRSAAYLLYAGISTVVWAIMVMASVLAHVANAHTNIRPSKPSDNLEAQAPLLEQEPEHTRINSPEPTTRSPRHYKLSNTAAILSTILRRSGKLLATLNAVGIIVTCIFQFSNFFDRCFCNSSIFWLGSQRGYAVIDYSDPSILPGLKNAWLGGIVMALLSALDFIGFVNMFNET